MIVNSKNILSDRRTFFIIYNVETVLHSKQNTILKTWKLLINKSFMKTIYISFLFLLVTLSSSIAQKLIVVQNGGTPKFYTKLDSAIIKSQDGDTIYVPGGSFESIAINKKLYIFGVGHNTDSTMVTNYSLISGNIYLLSGADGGSLTGFKINGSIYFGNSTLNQNINNYSISRCNFSTLILGNTNPSGATGNSFHENIMYNIDGYSSENNMVSNNIIIGTIRQLGINNAIKNNMFLYQITCNGGCPLGSIVGSSVGCLFENNLFLSPNLSTAAFGSIPVSNSIFNNNFFVENWYMSNNCIGNNNLINQSPDSIFFNYSPHNNNFAYSYDYHLKSTCPGKNAGNDGTDIGIYGGAFPWKEGSIPSNPHFQTVKIAPTTDANGNLNVNIKVRAQDN